MLFQTKSKELHLFLPVTQVILAQLQEGCHASKTWEVSLHLTTPLMLRHSFAQLMNKPIDRAQSSTFILAEYSDLITSKDQADALARHCERDEILSLLGCKPWGSGEVQYGIDGISLHDDATMCRWSVDVFCSYSLELCKKDKNLELVNNIYRLTNELDEKIPGNCETTSRARQTMAISAVILNVQSYTAHDPTTLPLTTISETTLYTLLHTGYLTCSTHIPHMRQLQPFQMDYQSVDGPLCLLIQHGFFSMASLAFLMTVLWFRQSICMGSR